MGFFPSICPFSEWAMRSLTCYASGGFLMAGDRPMSDALLRDIAQYCRGAGIAESTFGRLAVNDGKLVNRLRLGGRVTTETAERVRAFIGGRGPRATGGRGEGG